MKIKNFILFALPCLFWWGFILYLIFGNIGVSVDNKYDILSAAINKLRSFDLGTIILVSIQLIIFFPITVLGIVVICVGALIAIPVLMFINGFYFNNLILWLSSIIFLINFIAAYKYKKGEFEKDSSYVSGYHYKIEEDNYGDIKVTKENEYSGGGEWLYNFFKLIKGFIMIAFGGIIIYIVLLVKSKKMINENQINNMTDDSESE